MKKYVVALCLGLMPFGLSASELMYILRKSWKLINLDEAYKENPGIDGSGVNLGVIDRAFSTTHPSLAGKDVELINGSSSVLDQHGTHVAGIAIGAMKGDSDPHGIAYKGKYYGLGKQNPSLSYTGNLYEDVKNWNVKIINNSWVATWYPLNNRYYADSGYAVIDKNNGAVSADYYFNTLLEWRINQEATSTGRRAPHDTLHLIRLSKEKDILNVMAAGNEGKITPAATAVAPSYDEDVRAWLVVGALDAQGITIDEKTKHITIMSGKCSGNRANECNGAASYSNAFKGAALYAITAPGSNIDSANANFSSAGGNNTAACDGDNKEEFCAMSGTSQATPMVSGAAMLVQQKFGFLGGAQLADVLLTTANNNYTAPKITIKSLPTSKGGTSFNIIYIDNEPPMKNGKIDRDKVRQDLKGLGYTESEITKMFNNLSKTNQADDDAEAIIKLSKEEVFGQGILDVQKALKGLARLDVNRMNKNSVEHFEGENQAFYTIDTKGLSGEFSNNIDQRLWEDKWHIDGAWNSPKEELKDIKKVGLIKTGQGKLTLSGANNTYEGATRVLQGVLEVAQNSKLSKSNAYAEGYGVFSLKGEVSNNLTAKNGGLAQLSGTAKVGKNAIAESGGIVQILDSGTIIGGITAKDSGIIQLGKVESGTNTSGATLATSSITLQNGGILAGAGTIQAGSDVGVSSSQVKNESGIVMAGFGAAPITSLTQNTLTIKGSYTQDSNAKLQIAFSGSLNSKLEATSYDIQGGTLEFVPIYSGEGSLLTAGKTIQLNLGSLKDHTNKFDTILPQSNNVLDFIYDHTKQTLSTTLKNDAFSPSGSGDSSMGDVIKDIFQDPSLSKDYQDYFGAITNANSSSYQASIDSLAENASLDSVQDSFNSQQSLGFSSLSFALTPMQDMPSYNALRAYKRSVKVASVDNALSGKILADILSLTQNAKQQMIMNANYTLFSHKSYKASSTGTSFHYKNRLSNSLLLGGFLDYAYVGANHTYTQRNSHTFTLGGSGIYDFKHFSILGTASVGMGLNTTNKTIIGGQNYNINADYNTTILYIQGGVSKDFQVSKVVFKPMMLLSYSGVMQGAYKESGEVFARANSASMYNTFGTSLGLHIGYTLPLESLHFSFSGFGFYNVRFVDFVEAKSSFSDFASSSFTQKAMLDTHSFYGGVNAQMQYKDYFGRFGLSSEVSGAYTLLNINASVGMNF